MYVDIFDLSLLIKIYRFIDTTMLVPFRWLYYVFHTNFLFLLLLHHLDMIFLLNEKKLFFFSFLVHKTIKSFKCFLWVG